MANNLDKNWFKDVSQKEFYKNYGDDNDFLNDYVNSLRKRVSWNLFKKNFLCNAPRVEYENEHGISKNAPVLRIEDVEKMQQAFDEEISWLREFVIESMLYDYAHDGDISLDEEVLWYWFPDAFKDDEDSLENNE